jgi:hypothetical protein
MAVSMFKTGDNTLPQPGVSAEGVMLAQDVVAE